jgi:hypothetical protein
VALIFDPIRPDRADLVIGSRLVAEREPGALLPQALFGNWLATRLIRLFWGVTFTDLGPFRAIRATSLTALQMQDRDYGWTVEMQVKAAQAHLRCVAGPVRYRKRVGRSKITGTLMATIRASHQILATIFRSAWRR